MFIDIDGSNLCRIYTIWSIYRPPHVNNDDDSKNNNSNNSYNDNDNNNNDKIMIMI